MASYSPFKGTPIEEGDSMELMCEDKIGRQFGGLKVQPKAITSAIDELDGNTRLGDLVDKEKTHTEFEEKFLSTPFYDSLAVLLSVYPRSNPLHNKIGIIVPTQSEWTPEYSPIGDDTFSSNSIYVPATKHVITIREIAVESAIIDTHYVITTPKDRQYKLRNDSIECNLLPDSSLKNILQNAYPEEILTHII